MSEIDSIGQEIVGLRKELQDVYVSKSYASKLEAQIAELRGEMSKKSTATKTNKKFINDAVEAEACQYIVDISRDIWSRQGVSGMTHKSVRDLLTKTPADLSQWVNSSGGYTVQTSVYPILEDLFLQSGGVRKWFNTTQVQGRLQVSSATDYGVATFTGATANLAPTDTAAIDQTTLPMTASTLSPAPLTALYYLSRQLMYNTATNLVSRIFENLAKANTLAEDVTVLWGDGTSTYANNYGLQNVGTNYVATLNVNSAGKLFVPLNTTPATGHALPTLDDLINLTVQAQEEASLGEEVGFFMSRQVAAYFRSLKASTSGLYFLDVVTNPVNTEMGRPAFMFMGYPVFIWNRMSTGSNLTGQVSLTVDSSGAPHYTPGPITPGTTVPIVAFGSFKKAAVAGFNRGYAIESSIDYQFGNDLITYKGVEDFGVAWVQQTAPPLAVINVTGATS